MTRLCWFSHLLVSQHPHNYLCSISRGVLLLQPWVQDLQICSHLIKRFRKERLVFVYVHHKDAGLQKGSRTHRVGGNKWINETWKCFKELVPRTAVDFKYESRYGSVLGSRLSAGLVWTVSLKWHHIQTLFLWSQISQKHILILCHLFGFIKQNHKPSVASKSGKNNDVRLLKYHFYKLFVLLGQKELLTVKQSSLVSHWAVTVFFCFFF